MGTIEGGEGGVTAGDIDLLFEDADNELRHLMSAVAKLKFDFHKCRAKFENLVERYEFHASGTTSGAGQPLSEMGDSDDRRRPGRRTGRQQAFFVASRSPKTSSTPKAPKVKKEKE